MIIANSSLACNYIDDIINLAIKNSDKATEWDLNFIPSCLNEQRIDGIKQKIREHNLDIRYHLPYSYVELSHNENTIREFSLTVMKRNLKFINCLGGKTAIVHIGNNGQCSKVLALNSLSNIAEYADRLGIEICVENLIGGLTTDISFIKCCLKINNVYLCLDTGHAKYVLKDNKNYVSDILKFTSHIHHAHIYNYEDKDYNHHAFDEKSIKDNILLKELIQHNCAWMTMELDNIVDQNTQIELIKELIAK